jgi:F-type H+-transporting ATPase subunit a
MVDVSPQHLFSIFGIPITNTVVSTWIMMVVVVGAIVLIRRRRPIALELLVAFLDETVSGTLGGSAQPYLPFLGALAVFIAMANIFGVLPWVTTPTSDISTPAAMAITVFFAVHYFGIRAQGGLGYLKHLSSPIFMLPLEIIGQLSRTLSLTLRLFGNMVSTELVVAVFYALLPYIAPLPVIGLGLLTGVLQSYVFTSLAASYIAGAVRDGKAARMESPSYHPTS